MDNKKVSPATKTFLLMQLEPVEKSCKAQRNFFATAAVSAGAVGIFSFAMGQIPVGILFVSSAALGASLAIKKHSEYKRYKASNDLIRNDKFEEYVEKYSNSNNEIERSVCNLLSSELLKKEIKDSDIFAELEDKPEKTTQTTEISAEDAEVQSL